jgi:hypothetical protein
MTPAMYLYWYFVGTGVPDGPFSSIETHDWSWEDPLNFIKPCGTMKGIVPYNVSILVFRRGASPHAPDNHKK